jgi:hypothetical protein
VPRFAAQRRSRETGSRSPDELVGVTKVTAFKAMLRAKKTQPTAIAAIFHHWSGYESAPNIRTKKNDARSND